MAIAAAMAMVAAVAGCIGTVSDAGGRPPGAVGGTGAGPGGAVGNPGSGSGGAPGGGGVGTGPAGGGGAASLCAAASVDPGRVTLHRLNRLEYDNTVRDLLGDTSGPAAATFPFDTGGGNFDNNADVLATSPLLFEKLENASEAVANAAVAAGSPRRAQLITCDPVAMGDVPCATAILRPFVRRAWRRPATDLELAKLTALVTLARGNGDGFDQGVALALKAVLLSPHFVFRPELDPDPTAPAPRPLNSYEMASRLSYFLWASMPDDTLAGAADAGTLGNLAELQKQATRMMVDSRASTLISNMAAQWFTLDKLADVSPSPMAFPAFDESLRSAMLQETQLVLKDVLLGDASFVDAIDRPSTYVNDRLARHYGIAGVTGSNFRPMSLVGTGRAGLLTQASVLTVTSPSTRTAPVKRGYWVLSSLLCQPPPPPPDNIPPLDATPVVPGASLRARLEAHRTNPACSVCHNLMDPTGFALEHFDGIGQWRDKDGTADIDATGQLPDGTKFDGALQLAAAIKQRAPALSACAAQKVFAYSLGRDPVAADACQLQRLGASFAQSNYNIRSLIMQMVSTDAFRMRRPLPGSTVMP